MGAVERPEAAFILSLVGGVLILSGSVLAFLWAWFGMPVWGGMMGGMMGGFGGGLFFGMMGFGIVSGLIILLAAFMLYNQPKQVSTWGTVILVFSLLSLFGMGGFFLGAILGIIGGILALTWKPATPGT